MLTPIFAILWRTMVVKLGIELLSPAGNDKRQRATVNTVAWLVVGFTVAGTLLSSLGFLALSVKLIGWLLWTVAWLGIFGGVFGLGVFRAIGLYLMMAVGQLVFRALIGHLPWGSAEATVGAFDMWRLTFGG